MKSLNENKLDADKVFSRWLAEVREDKSSQYSYGERKKHVQNLMGFLKHHDVSQNDAQMLKRKVVESLVTPDGLKGRDKYKGWKESVENDFDDAVQIAHVPALSASIEPLKNVQGYDPMIIDWCKRKYGEDVGDEFIKAAHQPLHVIWCMCINECLNRNTGERL